MDSESKVAIGLVIGGLGVLAVSALSEYGVGFGALVMGVILCFLVVEVILGLVACLAVAKIMGSSFGLLGHALIKLAGIVAVNWALPVLLPPGFGILSLVAYLALLYYLFELEWAEVIGFALVLGGLRLGAGIVFLQVMASMAAGG